MPSQQELEQKLNSLREQAETTPDNDALEYAVKLMTWVAGHGPDPVYVPKGRPHHDVTADDGEGAAGSDPPRPPVTPPGGPPEPEPNP